MERGIRQGDPLSPFLFLIVAEALSVMMKEVNSKGIFRPCQVGDRRLKVSHLQFADDTLFLGESTRNAHNLMLLLRNFGNASGLKINLQKSYLFGIRVPTIEVT